jgi:hypothetical protein
MRRVLPIAMLVVGLLAAPATAATASRTGKAGCLAAAAIYDHWGVEGVPDVEMLASLPKMFARVTDPRLRAAVADLRAAGTRFDWRNAYVAAEFAAACTAKFPHVRRIQASAWTVRPRS